MSTNVGSLAASLAMGYDPSGLKLFKSDIVAARQASVDMIAGMSRAASNLDPMMSKLSKSIRDIAAAEQAAFKASTGARHAGLNGGASGTQDFTKLEASLRIQADREVWKEHARLRDQQIAEDAAAWRSAERKRASLEKPTTPSFGSMMGSTQGTIGYKDPMIEALSQFQRNGGNAGAAAGPAGGSAGGKGFQGGMMAQQIGFGLQDFMSQVQNSKNTVDGLGRGIMAVSNNVQMLGAAFGPTGLAITAIGGAVAGIVLPAAIKWAFQTKDLAEQAKEVRTHVEAIAKLSHSVIEIKIRGGVADKVSGLEEEKAIATSAKADLEKRRKTAQQQMRTSAEQIRQMKEAGVTEFGNPVGNEAQATKTRALRDQVTLLAQAKEESEVLGKLEDEQTKKINQTNSALKAIAPQAQTEKQIENQRKISKFLSEDDAASVVRNRNDLVEKRKDFENEIAIREDANGLLDGQEQVIAEKRLKEIKEQRDLNEAVIKATQHHVDRKQASLLKGEGAETEAEYQSKAQEEITKLRLRELEEYGSEYSKMIEKHKREQKELELATIGAVGREAALRQQKDQHAIDLQKVKVDDHEKYLASLGTANGPSSGVDLASSEGIQAINRAMSGGSEQSVAKQQLDVAKEQLKTLQEMAHLSPEDANAATALRTGTAELGGIVPMDSLPMVDKANKAFKPDMPVGDNEQVNAVLQEKRAREEAMSVNGNRQVYEMLGAKDGREQLRTQGKTDVQDVLAAKRERESSASEKGSETVKAILELKRVAEEQLRKPSTQVVALSG